MRKSFVHRTSSLRTFFDSNALWLSMVIGVLGYKWLHVFSPLLPSMIFLMLFFSFCKIDPKDLRLHRWHWAVLAVQIVLAIGSYYALFAITRDRIVAQGLMMCFIMPTATAAPVIAGKLGGSIQNLTTFTLLSNFATALVVPAFFPLIYTVNDMTFWPAFLLILSRVSPLLLGPFFAAWLLRIGYNYYQRRKYLSASETRGLSVQRSVSGSGLSGEAGLPSFSLPASLAPLPFYLWVGTIVFLMAQLTWSFTNHQSPITNTTIVWLLLGSLLSCLLQFFIGKRIGRRLPAPSRGKDYEDVLLNPDAPRDMPSVSSVTAGQAFGQKNTTLGVWMAQTYLNPVSALGAAAYIIWQNLFNSVQLYRAAHGKPI